MTPEQIKKALSKHKLWLYTDGEKGKRANLERANLSGANLEGADLGKAWLIGANLTGANLKESNLTLANLYRANLEGANLYMANLAWANMKKANMKDANLTGANLWGTIDNMKQIKSIQLAKSLHLETYPVTYTFDRLQISYENHSIEEWSGFGDEIIKSMHGGGLEWWGKYRDHIFKTIELSPATPTGYERKQS